jgi:general secretion pathway protein G
MFLKVVADTEAGGLALGAQARGDFASVQASRKELDLAPSLPAPHPRRSRGFTLLEMLAVIVLLGIVAVIVARSVSGRVDTGKWDAGKIGVTKLDQDVQAYALDNGSPPKALDDMITKPLNAPSWNGPYAKPADLADPFGHPYGYLYPGKHGQYDILFYGRDGKPGGEGIDRDYGNWQ